MSKDRVNPNHWYDTDDIIAVNQAKNNRDKYHYLTLPHIMPDGSTSDVETGILSKGSLSIEELTQDKYKSNRINATHTIVEVVAVLKDDAKDVKKRFERELEYLNELEKKAEDVYPIKFLFPYNLGGQHWTAGEIEVRIEDDEVKVEKGYYDPYGKYKKLEGAANTQIEGAFREHYGACDFSFDTTKSGRVAKIQEDDSTCGSYSASAVHNLKTKPLKNIWDGIPKSAAALRQEDVDLVRAHNPDKLENFLKKVTVKDAEPKKDEVKFANPIISEDEKKCNAEVREKLVRLKKSPTPADRENMLWGIKDSVGRYNGAVKAFDRGLTQQDSAEFLTPLLSSLYGDDKYPLINVSENAPAINPEKYKKKQATGNFTSMMTIEIEGRRKFNEALLDVQAPKKMGKDEALSFEPLGGGGDKKIEAKQKVTISVRDSNVKEIALQLKRFGFDGNRIRKINKDVELNNIEIPVYGSKKKITFEPTAIIYHVGKDPNSGHYITYAKEINPEGKAQWYEYNDSVKRPIGKDDIIYEDTKGNEVGEGRKNEKGVKKIPLIEFRKKKAYVVKYSAQDERGNVELPNSSDQMVGTTNPNNACYAIAAVAFAGSFVSFKEHDKHPPKPKGKKDKEAEKKAKEEADKKAKEEQERKAKEESDKKSNSEPKGKKKPIEADSEEKKLTFSILKKEGSPSLEKTTADKPNPQIKKVRFKEDSFDQGSERQEGRSSEQHKGLDSRKLAGDSGKKPTDNSRDSHSSNSRDSNSDQSFSKQRRSITTSEEQVVEELRNCITYNLNKVFEEKSPEAPETIKLITKKSAEVESQISDKVKKIKPVEYVEEGKEDHKKFRQYVEKKYEGFHIESLEQYSSNSISIKTLELVEKEIQNQGKVFDNKLARALNNLRKVPEHLGKDEVDVENTWKSLTTLDRRVLVDYHNISKGSDIDFMSLYEEAKDGEKAELTVDSKNYVFNPKKIEDMKNILSNAAADIPKNLVTNPVVEKLIDSKDRSR